MSGCEFLKVNFTTPITLPATDRKIVNEIINFRPGSYVSDIYVYNNDTIRNEIMSRGVTYGIDYGF